jgi:DNA-binding NtrC family response regulator
MTATASTPRLLLVDDDEAACTLLAEVLERESYSVVRALSGAEALERVDRDGPFDAVLTDLRMPGSSGLELLRDLRARDANAIVFVLTAFGDAAAAGEAIRAGAHDFISKPYDLGQLRVTIGRALARSKLASSTRGAPVSPAAALRASEPTLVGHSPAIIEVMKTVARVAPSQASVLIFGETGAGKELVARAIHRYSDRAQRKFVAVNCSALAEGILESELFGHVKGAFTGANVARPGLFREADGGTLFLDEIGDISPAMQTRLLRVLQERVYEPLGGVEPVRADVRVIAASNKSLDALVREGKFREDLFYRVNVVRLELPALRDRREDLPLLIDHLVARFNRLKGRDIASVSDTVLARLMEYDFPGNVRELENVIEHAFALCRGGLIEMAHLPPKLRGDEAGLGTRLPSGLTLAAMERLLIRDALRKHEGNRAASARELGIDASTLFRKIKALGIRERNPGRSAARERGPE